MKNTGTIAAAAVIGSSAILVSSSPFPVQRKQLSPQVTVGAENTTTADEEPKSSREKARLSQGRILPQNSAATSVTVDRYESTHEKMFYARKNHRLAKRNENCCNLEKLDPGKFWTTDHDIDSRAGEDADGAKMDIWDCPREDGGGCQQEKKTSDKRTVQALESSKGPKSWYTGIYDAVCPDKKELKSGIARRYDNKVQEDWYRYNMFQRPSWMGPGWHEQKACDRIGCCTGQPGGT